jgi:hypothetical protein
MTTEEWRTSPSLPEYEVSSWGRVRRKTYLKDLPNGGQREYGGKEHIGQDSGEGRMIFVFRGKTYKVHQLVCEAFNGPRQGAQVCMHLDEDYRNNRPENLRWGSQKENLNAPKFLAYCRSRLGDESPVKKGKLK